MSLWLEILKHAAVGDSEGARRLLNFELPQVLRWAEGNRAGDSRGNGPVSKIVRIFIASLGETDRGMAKSRSEDFVDYISDLIVAKVRRTVSLVEFCREYPEMSIVQIAKRFTGWDGLKLGQEDRINWVRKHLRSMSSAGIEISSAATEEARSAPTNEDEIYGYHELALVRKWRADLSWKDFKEQLELDSSYISVADAGLEEDPNVAQEAFDYGAISAARVLLNLNSPTSAEAAVDLNRLGAQLTVELLDLLETFQTDKPADGYLPIAWHNVWWIIASNYEAVPLDLNERDPFCEVDRTLADYIGSKYPTVFKPNRLNIQRRRTKLQDKCVEHTNSVLIGWVQNPAQPKGSSPFYVDE